MGLISLDSLVLRRRVVAWLPLGLLALTLLDGCATPRLQPLGLPDQPPSLEDGYAVMDDGYRLPLALWRPAGEPLAMVLALHGFNDYHQAFARAGPFLARRGILTYAYDQRGFGATRERGLWPGTQRLGADLRLLIDLVRQHNPGVPLYLLGESMGGALVLVESQESPPLGVAGILLVAPAVWGGASMPPLQRLLLWITAHTLPGLKVTGEGLDILASDNIAMLRAQGRDPQVIKRTRVDALWGLSHLMDQASAAPPPAVPTLVLYGEGDAVSYTHLTLPTTPY